jgi:hypothetical protein
MEIGGIEIVLTLKCPITAMKEPFPQIDFDLGFCRF